MFRRCLTRWHKAARPDHPAKPAGSGGMQRPGANVWMLRENITPADVWKWLSETYFNHKVLGFAARCVVFGTVVSGSLLVLYRALVLAMENRPIAKQWVPRFRELTFIERIEEKGTEMSIYRFALPNSYDYLGYDSVSSVELMFDNDPFFPCRRWLTPISHPDQRGVAEFACKFHNPGEFSLKLWSLVPGDKVLMGPWIKEFKYAANKYKEIGIICANSGITPALQLLVRSLDDKNDTTKFSLLYCNASPATTPFYKKLREIEAKYPDRLKVTFAVSAPNLGTRGEEVVAPHATKQLQQHGWPSSSYSKSAIKGSVMAYDMGERGEIQPVKLFKVKDGDFEGYVGNVSRDLILETMPMPNDPNTKILCCGPQGMMSILCGRPQGWFRTTYFQGFYHGVLQEMGYPKSQVYKFGTSISLWMKFT